MTEYDFCEELKDVYKHKLFANETIRYYLNGFTQSLGLDLQYGNIETLGFSKIKDNKNDEYISDSIVKDGEDYSIKVMRNIGKKYWIKIEGNSGNMHFSLDSYYKRHRNPEDLPFNVDIEINNEECAYSMKAYSDWLFTSFIFTRRNRKNFDIDNIYFFVKRRDFENTLKVLMKFIENPDYVIDMYKEIKRKNDKIRFQKGEVDLKNEIILDENGKKLEKILK